MPGTFNEAIRRHMPNRARECLLSLRHFMRARRAEKAVAKFKMPVSRPHNLPAKLVVSLTSYPARYGTLHKTLRSLLTQTVQADHIVLWLAHGDERTLPIDVLSLQSHGLQVNLWDDIRSYKKIIPSLHLFPDSYIVTADDDLYYEPHWLETIVGGFVPDQPIIVCRRAHRPRVLGNSFAPYATWEHDVVTDGLIEDCIFPTTGAGALFPPGSLASEVKERSYFEILCPDADDIWLFIMAMRAGARFKQVGKGFVQIAWNGTQTSSLMTTNLAGGNDRQLTAVLKHFNKTRARPSGD